MSEPRVDRFMGADGRQKVFADGLDVGMEVMVAALRACGATSVELEWAIPFEVDGDDDAPGPPPSEVPVLWRCLVTFPGRRRIEGRSPKPTLDRQLGMAQATAAVMRQLGMSVAIVQEQDSPEGLT
jgi:hypothetical protein